MDLLVFGPHPDDIEIGIAGIVARHAAEGARVGLCDLTGGEMGSNGTVPERIAEGEAARKVLGAAWRENLGWPDREIGKDPGPSGARRVVHSPPSPQNGRDSLLVRSPSGPRRGKRAAH